MSAHKTLLIELGCEELPPGELPSLATAFCEGLRERLLAQGIACREFENFFSPRRLALRGKVAARQADRVVERRGPSRAAALDAEGRPTPALLGFARSAGVAPEALQLVETDKGAFFLHRRSEPGRPTAELLPGLVEESLAALPAARPMRWGSGERRFVRPVRWLLILLDGELVPGEVLGIPSGRESRGHRFHHPGPVPIRDASSYLQDLRAARVLADPAERAARIREEVAREAAALGLVPALDEALLAELVALTEWPRAVSCAFDREFLRVPPEVLRTTMVQKQRFVPLLHPDGSLSEQFLGIANLDSRDPGRVRHGYERVIRPRFADAAFFWDQDRATPLASHYPALAGVVYQKALGSVGDKCERVGELAARLAPGLGLDPERARQAARLARCDLMTRLVGEFPELQGTVGRRLAEAQGLDAELAAALEDFYCPRGAGDRLPEGPLAVVLAIADRLDTLAGGFAAGLRPTGAKDPFALRRAAAGLARIMIGREVAIDLPAWFAQAAALQPTSERASPEELYRFTVERLRADALQDGIPPEVFQAVAAVAPPSLPDFWRRLLALAAFLREPEAKALILASKRIRNILRKSGEEAPREPEAERLVEAAERALWEELRAIRERAERAAADGAYGEALGALAGLGGPLERFFTEVLVLCEDAALRRNRLALLAAAERPFRAIADFAELPG